MKSLLRAVRRTAHKIAQRRRVDDECSYPHFNFGSLMDDRGGCDRCPIYSGRCWWHETSQKVVNLEWHWFTLKNHKLGASLQVGGGESEGDLQFHVALPWLCNLYLTFEGYLQPRTERTWEVMYLGPGDFGQWGTLHLQFARLENDWNTPKGVWSGWSKWLDLADEVMGRNEYKSEPLREWDEDNFTLVVPWNGKREHHRVKAEVRRESWTRTRWPWRSKPWRTSLCLHVDSKTGIPIPGKGENSWDQGDDAMMGFAASVTGTSDDEVMAGAQQLVDTIVRTRMRYGGKRWEPVAAKGGAS